MDTTEYQMYRLTREEYEKAIINYPYKLFMRIFVRGSSNSVEGEFIARLNRLIMEQDIKCILAKEQCIGRGVIENDGDEYEKVTRKKMLVWSFKNEWELHLVQSMGYTHQIDDVTPDEEYQLVEDSIWPVLMGKV